LAGEAFVKDKGGRMKDEDRIKLRRAANSTIGDSTTSPTLNSERRSLIMDTDLRERTKSFALRIIKLYSALPKRGAAQVLGTQILKSGTSPGAHYREAQRAKSDADFISKIEGALQELDETIYWLELIGDAGTLPRARLTALHSEAEELVAILVTIAKAVKRRGRSRVK
jgi:four helix bundle protein